MGQIRLNINWFYQQIFFRMIIILLELEKKTKKKQEGIKYLISR